MTPRTPTALYPPVPSRGESYTAAGVIGVIGVITAGHQSGDDMRETYKKKGERYLIEGRLTVVSITGEVVTVSVKGAGEIYAVTADADRWRCTCPAKGPCCHIWAAQLVTLRPKKRQ